jgi:hypothetical protein
MWNILYTYTPCLGEQLIQVQTSLQVLEIFL